VAFLFSQNLEHSGALLDFLGDLSTALCHKDVVTIAHSSWSADLSCWSVVVYSIPLPCCHQKRKGRYLWELIFFCVEMDLQMDKEDFHVVYPKGNPGQKTKQNRTP
jgi:hypothetical protein